MVYDQNDEIDAFKIIKDKIIIIFKNFETWNQIWTNFQEWKAYFKNKT